MSPLHCVINWKVFLHWLLLFLIISNVIVLQFRFIFAQIWLPWQLPLISENLDSIFEFTISENTVIREKNVSISCTEPKSVQICLFCINLVAMATSSLENSDIIFEFADLYKPVIHAKKFLISCTQLKSVQFWLFWPKFGCHGNCPCFPEKNQRAYLNSPSPITLLHSRENFFDILYRTEISAILAYFCPNLVAMATAFAPLKIQIAHLNSTTPKTAFCMQKVSRYLIQNWNQCNFGLFLAKFGCSGNSVCSLENSNGIFEFADPKTLPRRKKCIDILYRNEVMPIF